MEIKYSTFSYINNSPWSLIKWASRLFSFTNELIIRIKSDAFSPCWWVVFAIFCYRLWALNFVMEAWHCILHWRVGVKISQRDVRRFPPSPPSLSPPPPPPIRPRCCLAGQSRRQTLLQKWRGGLPVLHSSQTVQSYLLLPPLPSPSFPLLLSPPFPLLVIWALRFTSIG